MSERRDGDERNNRLPIYFLEIPKDDVRMGAAGISFLHEFPVLQACNLGIWNSWRWERVNQRDI